MNDFTLDEQQLEALRPLAAVIEGAIKDTPIRLGSDDWGTMLASGILVRVAAYMGGVLPPIAEPGDWLTLGTRDLSIPEQAPADGPRVPCPDCSGAPLFRPDEITDHIISKHTGGDPNLAAAEWTRQAGKASATIEDLTANAGCSEHPNAGGVGPYCLACTIVPPPSGPCAHRGPHPGFTCAEVDATQPYFRVRWDQEQAAAAAEDAVCRRMETRTCPPSYNGPCGDRPCARFESNDPAPWTDTAEVPAAEGTHPLTSPAWRPGEGYDRCPRRVTGLQCVFRAGHPPHGCAGATSNPGTPTDEDAQRTDRRNSLLNLLARLDRDGVLVIGERMRMRLHIEAEIRESDTARTVAAGNKRHVQELYTDLEKADEAARRALEQREEMAEERYVIQGQRDTAQRLQANAERDRHAAVLAEVLAEFQPLEEGSTVYMAGPLDATTVDRWRSSATPTVAEMRAELEQAQAAIKRARVLLVAAAQATATGASDYDIGRHHLAVEAYTALDGPTETEV